MAEARKGRDRLPVHLRPADAEDFKARVRAHHAGELEIRINSNTSTLLSVEPAREGRPVCLSVHYMFVQAGDEVAAALGHFVKRATPRARAIIRSYINSREHEVAPRRIDPRRLQLQSRGRHYDLHRLAHEVNHEHFAGALNVYVTWGKGRRTRMPRRHILFGSFDHRAQLIRLHPALDSPTVPEFFVKFVIFHEMLHARLDPRHDADGKRYVHTAEFRDLESRHPDFSRIGPIEKDFLAGRLP